MERACNISVRAMIVIPVYNHAETLRNVVLGALGTGLSVLVVDDGSTDGSLDTVQGLGCITHRFTENQGKGAAVLAGARIAQEKGYNAIATVDADGQLDPSDVMILLKKTEETWPALVIGFRKMGMEDAPPASRFGRAFSNFWVRLESGLDLPDTQSGLRLYPVKQLLFLALKRKRYDFEVEVIVKSVWAGLPVISAPVSVYYPPASERVSHFNQFKDNWRLTLLHTSLVFRALMPFSHKKIMAPKIEEIQFSVWMHPIKLLKRLCCEHCSILHLATAVWLGFFMGALPLIAIHTISIIYVARKLHLNIMAAVSASQFCCPPVVPFLCIQLGYFLRKGSFLTVLSWQTVVQEMHLRFWDWLLGSLIIGPVLGFIGAAITFAALHSFRRNRLKAVRSFE